MVKTNVPVSTDPNLVAMHPLGIDPLDTFLLDYGLHVDKPIPDISKILLNHSKTWNTKGSIHLQSFPLDFYCIL